MKVSWDDYSQYMESHKIHVPNHQPGIFSSRSRALLSISHYLDVQNLIAGGIYAGG